jgi:hypothetical protein
MTTETVVAVLEAATQGLRRRPGLVEAVALIRAVHRMSEAEAPADAVSGALAEFAELIAERMVETIADVASLARAASVSNGARFHS